MPKYEYAEIQYDPLILDTFSYERGLWNEKEEEAVFFAHIREIATWENVLTIAKYKCTPLQYQIIFLVGKGLYHKEIAEILKVTRQNISLSLKRAIKNLKKYFEKCLREGVLVEVILYTESNMNKKYPEEAYPKCHLCGASIEGDGELYFDPETRTTSHKACQEKEENIETANESRIQNLVLGS